MTRLVNWLFYPHDVESRQRPGGFSGSRYESRRAAHQSISVLGAAGRDETFQSLKLSQPIRTVEVPGLTCSYIAAGSIAAINCILLTERAVQ